MKGIARCFVLPTMLLLIISLLKLVITASGEEAYLYTLGWNMSLVNLTRGGFSG